MAEGAMTDHQFRDRRWEHRDMARLIGLTELAVDPELAGRAPGSMPSRIELRFADGSEAAEECLYHPGHSFAGTGLDEAVVRGKFARVAGPRLGAEGVAAVSAAVLGPGGDGLAGLMALLRGAGG
jgi:2-methylcitrate dehydratase PrpD